MMLRKNGMSKSFTWDDAAAKYMNVYKRALDKKMSR